MIVCREPILLLNNKIKTDDIMDDMETVEKAIKLENILSYCRACLRALADQRHNIQEIPIPLVRILGYAGLERTNCDRIRVFPDAICENCYDIISRFEELQIKITESTKFLEDLFLQTKIKSSANTDIEASDGYKQFDSKNQEADPLEKNEDFESVLVKLEVEFEQCSSNEDETNKDDATEEDSQSEKAPKFTNKSDLTSGTDQIVCKYGCGRKFRRPHNAEAHYRFKHKHLEIENTGSIKNADPVDVSTERVRKREEALMAQSIEVDESLSSVDRTTCTICLKQFTSVCALRSHMSTHGEIRPFQCDQCNRGFNMKARLKRHIREVHQENPPEIHCKYGCGKMFTRHESAMNHYRVKHILPEKGIVPKTNTYICEDCGKTFKTMHNLKEHSYTHKPHTERPFQCEQCQKRFISKRPYEIHLLRHAGIKNFECNICGLRTTTHNELRNHMNHHTKAKQVNCPICSKSYTNPDNLRRHTLIVHQGVKNYKCRFCEEKFGKPDHLKHHEMRHTGERPHKCQICDRGFIQLVALKAHMKTHNKAPKSTEKDMAN